MYWANMAKRCTIPNCIDVRRAHPLYIWGDDCQYNEQYEKLIVVVMGHCLDPRTFSIVLLERSFLGVNCEFDCLFPPKDFGFVEVIKWFLCYRRSCHLDALGGSFDWVSHFVCLPRTSILPWLVNATSTLIPWNTWHVWYLSRKCAVLPAQVVKSMDHLLRGVPIPPAFGTGPLQALITQVRADWKFHRDIWLFIYDQPWL